MTALGGRRSSLSAMACDQCFRLKVRCDGASPTCASCERLEQRCTYLRPDRRKSSKVAVTQLLERVRLLEKTLKEHNIPIPSSLPPQQISLPPQQIYSAPRADGSVPGPSDTLVSGGWSTVSLLKDQEDSAQWLGDDRERALMERIDGRNNLTAGLDPEMELLVKRTGSLQFTEHGQLKYFGTTSNVHFLRTGIPFQPGFHGVAFGDSHETWLERAGVGYTFPREVEDHLIRLYFTWQNPYFNVVDRDTFMEARKRALSGKSSNKAGPISSCYSELLVNAMCSWGALFSDRTIPEIPGSLHDFFLLRARALLERDIDNPTIATVQALAMMSGSEASKGRDSRGWLYDSMAARLAHHLGLHLDVEHYVQSNEMTRQEANARSSAFWGTYVIDTAWSYYLGRLTMPVAGANRIPVRMPYDNQSGQPRYWENYTDANLFSLRQHVEPLASMWEHQVKLCYIMERLQKAFYDKHTGSISQLRAHTFAVTCDLDKWLENLPPDLTIDTNSATAMYLPHVLVLHSQFHETMIFANHPFITTPRMGKSTDSRRKYVHSAKEITKIVGIYKRLWTLRRINIQGIHPMFTAAMVHLYIACTSKCYDEFTMAISDLQGCCEAVKDASQAFELAMWQLRSIHRVCQVWHDLLEDNQNNDSRLETASSPGKPQVWPQDRERWTAIQEAIQKSMGSINLDLEMEEQVPWFDMWVQIQQELGVDPFSVGCA